MQIRDIGLLLDAPVRFLEHGGLDCAWKNSVDADVMRPVFRREDLREADQARFAGRIGCDAGETNGMTNKGARENHRASTSLQHSRDLILGPEESASQIDPQCFVPPVERNIRDSPLLAMNTGVVEGDIQVAIPLLC